MTKHERSHESSHLRWNRHTTLKPFPCTFPNCARSFTAKSSLNHHLLHSHDGKGMDSSHDINSLVTSDESDTTSIRSDVSSPHYTMVRST